MSQPNTVSLVVDVCRIKNEQFLKNKFQDNKYYTRARNYVFHKKIYASERKLYSQTD
jgi:hypothetical protein